MSFSFKKIILITAIGLLASVAQAEKVRVEQTIKNLAATFEAKNAKGEYEMTGAQVNCLMKLKVGDVHQEADCSQAAAIPDGATLIVKKADSKKIEVVMTSTSAKGKVSKETIRGKFASGGTQDGLNVSKYKMDLNDLRKKFAKSVSEQGLSMKLSIKFQGDGEILAIDDGAEIRLIFPTIALVIEGQAN